MNTQDFAAQQSEEFLQRLFHRLKRAFHSQTPEAVHQLRVATRRFLQASEMVGSRNRESKRLLRRLKKTFKLAGSVRDYDIAIRTIGKSQSVDARDLQNRLVARRRIVSRTLREVLGCWVSREAFGRWRAALDAGVGANTVAAAPIRETAAAVLIQLTGDLIREGNSRCRRDTSAAELHGVRILAKKLRYSFELFLPILGGSARIQLVQIKSVQSLLGDVNDCRVVRSIVRKAGGSANIEAALKRRQRRKTEEFRELFRKEFAGPGSSDQWLDSIRDICAEPSRKPMGRSENSRAAHAAAG